MNDRCRGDKLIGWIGIKVELRALATDREGNRKHFDLPQYPPKLNRIEFEVYSAERL